MLDLLNFAEATARARVMAAALALGRSLDLWSLALAALALAGLLWLTLPLTTSVGLLLSVVAGLAQKILALRVAFDAAIFHHWAESWSGGCAEGRDPSALVAELMMLDQALAGCGLAATQNDRVRDLSSRLRGAERLLKWQVLAFTIQFVAVVAAVMVVLLSRAG